MPRSLHTSADSVNPQLGARPGRLEHRLLLLLLLESAPWATHGEAPPPEAPDVDVTTEVDWEYVARQARALSMTAPIYQWLAGWPDFNVPHEVETALGDDAERATCDTLVKVRDLHQVVDLLEREAIRALPYKGPALRAAVHDDLAFREPADLDVVVPLTDVRVARAPLFGSDTAREDVGWAVDAADGDTPGDRSCLVRALVADALLGRRGQKTTHRFGLNANDAKLEAHAWLESNGEIIVGGEAREAYTRIRASG